MENTLTPRKPYADISDQEWKEWYDALHNSSEWLAVDKSLFGHDCDEIGVSYDAFTHQGLKCEYGTFGQ